jgi:RNA polymerase sigma factor (TIGR02999 family)
MSELSQSQSDPGNAGAKTADQLLPLVYEELRQLAACRMAREPAGHTLQPTALVHEVWLRLMKNDNPKFANPAHFFGAAAEAMRRILIERARRKQAIRHGGGLERVDLDEIQVPLAQTDDQLLAINEALDKLAAETPVEGEVVKLRYFVGMTNAETAEALGLSERTVNYYWAHARAWLYHEISSGQGGIRHHP